MAVANLTDETLSVQSLRFALQLTPNSGGTPTTLPLTTPASCNVPTALAGMSSSNCTVDTQAPDDAGHGDSASCVVTVMATDNDGNSVTRTVNTETYLILTQPTNLPESAEEQQSERIYLPIVAGGHEVSE